MGRGDACSLIFVLVTMVIDDEKEEEEEEEEEEERWKDMMRSLICVWVSMCVG